MPRTAPIVDGLTETSESTRSLRDRLVDVISTRPGASTEFVANALGELERAFKMEDSPELKARLAAAMTILRQGPPSRGGSSDDD